jgi:hypothetical protein
MEVIVEIIDDFAELIWNHRLKVDRRMNFFELSMEFRTSDGKTTASREGDRRVI